jgi:hypothetical protein
MIGMVCGTDFSTFAALSVLEANRLAVGAGSRIPTEEVEMSLPVPAQSLKGTLRPCDGRAAACLSTMIHRQHSDIQSGRLP